MELLDSRRLTGPNLYADAVGVIAEIVDADPVRAIAAWRGELARILAALGWSTAAVHARAYAGGAALFFTAPLDVLLPATEVNEWAVASAASLLAGEPPLELEPALAVLRPAIEQARRPAVVALRTAAFVRDIPMILDDEGLTLGWGHRGITYALDQLPDVVDVPWARLGAIPVALVTGTNGKTTTTRLVARMVRLAGHHVGNTSSDGVSIDEQFVVRGDWSGPDAARMVLRNPAVEVAILEVARGGILRRGLAVERCAAALITNVTNDHLGSYGVDDLATMARVKAVVGRNAGSVVLNADDPALVALAPELPGPIVYFTRATDSVVVAAHRAAGGQAWLARGGQLVHARGAIEASVIAIDDVPLTFRGRAGYNVENALAAAALATELGLPADAIVRGLREFTSSSDDNRGRGNLHDVGGVRVMIDFGHNPAAVRGVLGLARALVGAGRLFVTVGLPGDRPDAEIVAVAHELAAAHPAHAFVLELADYLRGRAPGAVPRLIRTTLAEAGMPAAAISEASGEPDALRQALAIARPGDLVLVLAHVDDAALALLPHP